MNLTQILAWTPTLDPLLAPRADSTPLVPQGVAATLHAREAHTYEVPADLRQELITLSICSFEGINSTIYLKINGTSYATNYGVVSVDSLASFGTNGTIQIVPPSNALLNYSWNYQLGIGGSASYLSSGDDLFLVDTDFANSLLVTSPLNQIQDSLLSSYEQSGDDDAYDLVRTTNFTTSNFTLGIFPIDSNIVNISNSFCAIQQTALLNQNNADLSTTTRGKTGGERAQWLVKGLNRSSNYMAYLGVAAPEKGYIGGTMLSSIVFSTKTSTSCQVVYNMSFCSTMAFAVPGNASSYTAQELTSYYDELAMDRHRNFSYSLQQINCNLSAEKQFSPLRTCQDCDQAYRDWLCTTTIPRCADMSDNSSYLMTREPGQSRNPYIDEVIKPGPYKEILPCKELCYALARNCPASFGFGCPTGKMMELSYGDYSDDGDVTCSYPGAVYNENTAMWIGPSLLLITLAMLIQVL